MKLNKLSAIAVAVLAGGTISASAAAKTQQGSTFALAIDFSNSPPSLVSVSDIPQGTTVFNVTNDFSERFAVVDTDSGGKIDGAAFVRLGIGTSGTNGSTETAHTDVIGDVSGKVSNNGKGLTITERYKGTGYSAASGSNDTFFPNVSALAGAASVQVSFKSTSAPVQDTNSGNFFVSGTLTGSVKPGVATINGGKNQPIKNESAVLEVNSQVIDSITLDIVQLGSKFQALAFIGQSENVVLSGSGSISSKAIKANLKGHGRGAGANLQLSGTPAALQIGSTNASNSGLVTTFANPVTIKAKAQGQTFTATSTSVQATD